MNVFRLCGLVLAAALVETEVPEEGDRPKATIQDLEVHDRGETLEVSFRVDRAFGRDTRERIESGMPVTFSHRVELLVRWAVPVIPSRVLARAVVDSSVRYDSLTRQYYLSRQTTREVRGEDEPFVEETSMTTPAASDADAWLASVHDLVLPAPAPSARERKLRVRVRTVLGRRYHLLIFPATDSADAEQVLVP